MGGPRQPPLRSLDDPELVAYLAGMIDGEGTIGIYEMKGPRSLRPSFYVQITVTNTDTVLMDWLVATFGGRVDRRRDPSRSPRHRQPYAWRVPGDNAEALLHAVLPRLIVKRGQAAVALQLRELKLPPGRRLTDADVVARKALKDEMHRLNRRGT